MDVSLCVVSDVNVFLFSGSKFLSRCLPPPDYSSSAVGNKKALFK